MENQCCPSPDHPIVEPDEKGLKLRAIMKKLYNGQMAMCFIKFVLYGGLAGIFQLINLWVCYTAFATMHFCSTLIYLIMCTFDLMFSFMDWQRYEKKMEEDKEASNFVRLLFIMMILYNIVAIFYSYRAYNHFKILFFAQLGDYRGRLDSSGDDEENQYQQQQAQMRSHYQRQQQESLLQQQRAPQQQAPQNQNIPLTSANNNVHIQPRNENYQPPSYPRQQPPAVVVHDFTRNQTNSNNQSGYKPFAGQGYRLQ